jgi:uncharacterized glyoxalase superfamily protein PhnB
MPLQLTPNLLVTDVSRSVAFYTDTFEMTLEMSVDANQNFAPGELVDDAVFAVVSRDGCQLMLQSAASLAEDVPDAFRPDQSVTPSGTLYFRGLSPDVVRPRVEASQILIEPKTTWYGMYELYLRDPDGHVLCVGSPAEGAAPGGAG